MIRRFPIRLEEKAPVRLGTGGSMDEGEGTLRWTRKTGQMVKLESTEGGRRVSALKRQKSAPLNLR